MTRNNLTDHLAWLLDNVSLTKPACLRLSCGNAFAPNVSQQRPASRPNSVQRQESSITSLASQHNLLQALPSQSDAPITSQLRTDEAGGVVVPEANVMGRLTSSGKSKKPSLVSQQAVFPTPKSLVFDEATGPVFDRTVSGEYSKDVITRDAILTVQGPQKYYQKPPDHQPNVE